MKTKTIAILGTAALLTTTALATASEWHGGHGFGGQGFGQRHGMHGGMARMETMFERYDADGDGRVSQAEIDRARAERLAAFDQNGDRALSLDEYRALWMDAMRERMVDRFQDLDADGDGAVTADEFARPYARMVRRMDRNGDGAIGPEDMRHRRGWSDDDNDHEKDDD